MLMAFYRDDINTLKKNTQGLTDGTKEISPGVNREN
jgi:hypothetical protein